MHSNLISMGGFPTRWWIVLTILRGHFKQLPNFISSMAGACCMHSRFPLETANGISRDMLLLSASLTEMYLSASVGASMSTLRTHVPTKPPLHRVHSELSSSTLRDAGGLGGEGALGGRGQGGQRRHTGTPDPYPSSASRPKSCWRPGGFCEWRAWCPAVFVGRETEDEGDFYCNFENNRYCFPMID